MSSDLKYPVRTVRDEHDSDNPATKKVSMYAWDSDNLQKVRVSTDSDGNLKTFPVYGSIDEGNSSSSVLDADGVFTGTAIDIIDYPLIFISVYSDVSSAVDGLSIQQSSDGINWDHTDDYTITADSGKNYSIQRFSKYFRIVYTNGVVAQSEFRLQVVLSANSKPSSHRIKDEIVGDDDAELVKSALTGEDDNGNWRNVQVTADGNLAISDESSGLSIAQGNVEGTGFIHKFGHASEVDTSDGFVPIWDGAGVFSAGSRGYTYSTTADIDTLSSSSTADTQDIEVQGLDSDYNLIVQTVTLDGQSKVSLTTSLIRVFRLKNVGSADIVGEVYCYVDSTITAGVPNNETDVRAIIEDGNNQTLMAIYTVPAGETGYMRDYYAALIRSADNQSRVKLFARPFGQVFQLKHQIGLSNRGTSYLQHKFTEPEVFAEKTDIVLVADAEANDTEVSGGFDIVLVENE